MGKFFSVCTGGFLALVALAITLIPTWIWLASQYLIADQESVIRVLVGFLGVFVLGAVQFVMLIFGGIVILFIIIATLDSIT